MAITSPNVIDFNYFKRHHTSLPTRLVTKLNELVHRRRPISYLASTQLNGHLSSSSDCLSGDEGYFGSYTDSRMNAGQTQEVAKKQSINSAVISQQEQVMLLNYLLQSQQQVGSNETLVAGDTNNNIEAVVRDPGKSDVSEGMEASISIPCLSMFGTAKVSSTQFVRVFL